MMAPVRAFALLALAEQQEQRRRQRVAAIRVIVRIAEERAARTEPWWRWTVWLWAGIAVRRIEEAT